MHAVADYYEMSLEEKFEAEYEREGMERLAGGAPLATVSDAIREYGYNAGMENQEHAWLLTDYDVWVANPHYRGPPVRHPEDDDYGTEEEMAAHAADIDKNYEPGVVLGWGARSVLPEADDIPF